MTQQPVNPPDPLLLQRRLDRERAARAEAEHIAERSTRELYELGRRLDLILRGAGDGICGVDQNGLITFLNPAGARMLGRDSGDTTGKSFHDVVHPEKVQSQLCSSGCDLLRSIATAPTPTATLECLFERRDTTRVPVECAFTFLAGPGASRVGAVMVFRDITERRRAEEARKIAMERLMEIERLKEIDQFKTRFINIAAHELNTPITPTILQLHLLKSESIGSLNDQQRKALAILDRNVSRLAALVQDLLDVARIEDRRLQLRLEPVYLDRILSEVYESFRLPAEQAGLRLELVSTPDAWVLADAKRVTQVLYNFLSNAMKFTPRGGRIGLSAAREDGQARVRVQDTGVGLNPDQIGRLFRPFSQTHEGLAVTRSGAGLGLYISKGIVEEHGGLIGCESPGPNEGSTFWFTLPLAMGPHP